ncbi:MAG: acyl carrier protein [Sandaracinus sp.]|nr:acyl carrier protein [Sandaracinus sp.]|tara:strand:- start:4261 stop:4548 length:288 start_codon:yes stop_codon:yes gene_type:complete
MTREEIYQSIVEILSDSFELDPDSIKPESTLYEELDLDSIDAVDIFVQLRDLTGRRPDPERAKEVRTVDELVTFVEEELAAAERGDPEPDVQMPT